MLVASGCQSADTSDDETIRRIANFDGVSAEAAEFLADQARTNGVSEFQAQVFADSSLTFEEYQQSVLDFSACTEDGGISLGELRLDGQIYGWVTSEDPDTDPVLTRCYEEYLSLVDAAWQGSVRESERARGIDPERDSLIRCLNEADIAFDEGASSGELSGLVLDNGIDPFSC